MELIVLTQNGKTLGINLSVSISREHFLYSCKYFFFFFCTEDVYKSYKFHNTNDNKHISFNRLKN